MKRDKKINALHEDRIGRVDAVTFQHDTAAPGAPDGAGKRSIPAPLHGGSGWPWEAPETPRSSGDRAGGIEVSPKVSVVVPSFRQGRFIEATIRSVLLQDYPNIELIVMDGGSQDETTDVLKWYDAAIDHWVSEPDRGQTHAINKGMERVTGEIVTYLNSDDLLHPGAIRHVVEGFREHPDAGVVYGECIYVDEGGRERYRQAPRVAGLLSYLRIWERFRATDYITQPEAFIRRSALDAAGPFREELHSVMDFEMWLRLLSLGVRFQFIPYPVAHFRTYPSQKSSVDPGDELCAVVEEYVRSPRLGLTADEQKAFLAELKSARSELLVRAAIAANILGHYPKAVRYSLAAARQRPGVLASYLFWSVLGHPLKRLVPASVRGVIRPASGQGDSR